MEKKYIAPVNLSKLGFRYFRIVLESKMFSRRFIQYVVNHPNTGFIFQGHGWSGKKRVLGIGIWAANNAEMIDISNNIRSKMSPSYTVVYQSELTRLEFFSQVGGDRKRMILLDGLENKISFSALELEFLKLMSIDGSAFGPIAAKMLGISTGQLEALDNSLKEKGVYYGILEDRQLPEGYTKFFIDTSSLPARDIEKFSYLLSRDAHCVYLAQGNGKYNFEFEYVVGNEKKFKDIYGPLLAKSKRVRFDDNIFTNLFPQSKFINIKKIEEAFIKLARDNESYFDLRNSELWYINHDGAKAYLNIYADEKYKKLMNQGEAGLFPDLAPAIATAGHTYNIIDLGSGDGTKGKLLIEALGEKHVRSYFPVDIQELELAQTLKMHEGASYSIHPTILNFDKLAARFPINKKIHETSIYALLGGTYGNFQSAEINAYLQAVLEGSGDKLVVAMPVREHKTEAEILDSYLNENTENMAFSVLKQIGFEKSDFECSKINPKLSLQLRMEDNRVVSSFVLKQRKNVFGRWLSPGTKFDVTTSWKPTKMEFLQALSNDFKVDTVVSNKSFALAVCSKK